MRTSSMIKTYDGTPRDATTGDKFETLTCWLADEGVPTGIVASGVDVVLCRMSD